MINFISNLFQSDAEKQVNALYAKPAPVITPGDDFSGSWDYTTSSPMSPEPGLSLWDRFKEAIVPESYGESLVREVYGNGASRTLQPDPVYNRDDLSSPNVYVRGKAALTDAVSAFSGFGTKALIIVGVFLLLAVIAYALPGALLRR